MNCVLICYTRYFPLTSPTLSDVPFVTLELAYVLCSFSSLFSDYANSCKWQLAYLPVSLSIVIKGLLHPGQV